MMPNRFLILYLLFAFSACSNPGDKKTGAPITVTAYYSGNATLIDSFPVEKLTHIIFSFCHLKGNQLSVDDAGDTATIQKLVTLKSRNPQLKVLLSLGGWGGCEFCSPVFASDTDRKAFAASVKNLCDYFNTDGIDLDWEYPAIQGYPGHAFMPEDKAHFTALVKELRNALGNHKEISFAAGGFKKFIDESIAWKEVMPLLDRVNLMSYDLVHGYSTITGHHTPLYSTASQNESADFAIRYMDSIGVPKNKIVIGAAFYARTWKHVEPVNNGLYQQGKFKNFIGFRHFENRLHPDSGFIIYHDSVARANYAYNAVQKIFATFDDTMSIRLKTEYAIENNLDGIMFWELSLDKLSGGLLDVIDAARKH